MGGLSRSHKPCSLSESIISATSPLRRSLADSQCLSPVTPRRISRNNGGYSPASRFLIQTSSSTYPPFDERSLPTPRSANLLVSDNEKRHSRLQNHLESNGRPASTSIPTSPSDTEVRHIPSTPQILTLFQHGKYAYSEEGKLGTFSAINIIIGKTVGVGVYSVPSSIFAGVGSVGMSILMWILGALISFCGLAVYLDLGTALPKSGGERVYLERIFRRPHMLATCMFMAYVVLLGFSTPNCIVLGEYVLYALDMEANRWNVRCIAVAVITLTCFIHARYPKSGLRIINALGVGKMLILVIVLAGGVASMVTGVGSPELTARRLGQPTELRLPASMLSTAERNFSGIWKGSSTQPYDYATALLKVLYCFRGYSGANQIMSQLSQPTKTLRVAAPIALSLVSAGYILANIAYFLAVEKDDFRNSGLVVAGHFFRNVFGVVIGERVLPCFIIISAFGNIAATSFSQARVNQELAKDGMLPFARFFSKEGSNATASRGLLLHWLVSVVVIVVPPPGQIYNFLVEIGGYPVSVISVAISFGLLKLQTTPNENWNSPFQAKKIYIVIFLLSNCVLLILPWISPRDGMEDDGRLPYYAYPATALLILGLGAVYWVWWATISPRLRNNSTSYQESDAWWLKQKMKSSALSNLAARRWNRNRRHSDDSNASQEDAQLLDSSTRVTNRAQKDDQNRNVQAERAGESSDQNKTDVRRRAPCGCPIKHAD